MDYGPKFDQELEKLLWEFLIRLDQLLPVPDLAQVVGAFENSCSCFCTSLSRLSPDFVSYNYRELVLVCENTLNI